MDELEIIDQKNDLSSVSRLSLTLNEPIESHELSTALGDVRPMPHINSLVINAREKFTVIDDTSMIYIMKKFPKLKSLKINSGSEFLRPETRVSLKIASRFLVYL
jgi:hypothetical protein